MSKPLTKLQKYSAPALEKGLDILEFLSITDTRSSLSQIAAGIGRSKSEIFRMMIVLEERGYIERFDGDIFGMSDRMALVGGMRSDNGKLAELATPYLDSLSDHINLSSHLSVGCEEGLVVIASASAIQNYGLSVLVGYKTKLFGTSAGACILAGIQDRNRQDEIMTSFGAQIDPQTLISFKENVKRCQQYGFAAVPSPEAHSILEMSAAVMHPPSKAIIGAVTVPIFQSDTMDNQKESIARSLIKTVEEFQNKIAISMPAPRQSGFFI